jgi:hypothetical protein
LANEALYFARKGSGSSMGKNTGGKGTDGDDLAFGIPGVYHWKGDLAGLMGRS